jgi:hypothetical protein
VRLAHEPLEFLVCGGCREIEDRSRRAGELEAVAVAEVAAKDGGAVDL